MITFNPTIWPTELDALHLAALLFSICAALAIFMLWSTVSRRTAEALGLASDLSEVRAASDALEARAIEAEAANRALVARTEATEAGLRRERQELEQGLAKAEADRTDLAVRLKGAETALEERLRAFDQERETLKAMRDEVEAKFNDLAGTALRRSQAQFLDLANETFAKHREGAEGNLKSLLEPVSQTFGQFREKVGEIEKVRSEDRARFDQLTRSIGETVAETKKVTGDLVRALSAPKGSGRWGEQTLRNVLELAGLSAYADFEEQVQTPGEGRDRPDAVIRLPGGRSIVIDAKCSIDAYLQAAEASDPSERDLHLATHARHVRDSAKRLSLKSYWDQLPDAVDFVAMFIPGENFFAAAAAHDRTLFEDAFKKNVIIVTPATLVALAKAVAFGWRQEQSAKNAREAADLARELYERIGVALDHVDKLGRSLSQTVGHYNRAVGSLETRVVVTARKFEDLHIPKAEEKAPPRPEKLEIAPRSVTPSLFDARLTSDDDAA